MKKIVFWVLNAVFFVTAISYRTMVPVHAYIDPSAVTYLIQAIAAVVIAIGACLTIFRHKIAAFFKKNKEETKKEVHFIEDEDQNASPEENIKE